MFPILHHAGILQGETHTNVDAGRGSPTLKCLDFFLNIPLPHSCILMQVTPAVDMLRKLLLAFTIVPNELHIIPLHHSNATRLVLDSWLGFQFWNRDSSGSTSAT